MKCFAGVDAVSNDIGKEFTGAQGERGVVGADHGFFKRGAMRVKHLAQKFRRKAVRGILAYADGRLAGIAARDHLFIAKNLVAHGGGALVAMRIERPGKFAGGAEAAEAAGHGVMNGLLKHVHHELGLKASVGEIDFVFGMKFQRAALGLTRGIKAKFFQSAEEEKNHVRLLRAETALTAAESVCQVMDE